jgi:hypothetical protein
MQPEYRLHEQVPCQEISPFKNLKQKTGGRLAFYGSMPPVFLVCRAERFFHFIQAWAALSKGLPARPCEYQNMPARNSMVQRLFIEK